MSLSLLSLCCQLIPESCVCAPPPQVTGVLLLSVGLWWAFMLGPYLLLISSGPSIGPYVLMGTGAAVVLFGLFGCFATCRGRPWMLRLVSPLTSDLCVTSVM